MYAEHVKKTSKRISTLTITYWLTWDTRTHSVLDGQWRWTKTSIIKASERNKHTIHIIM